YQNAVTRIPYATTWNGRVVPSFAALLAHRTGSADQTFIPDYSLDPYSIPSISADRILKGQFNPHFLRGKDVIIGTASDTIGDQFFVPNTGKMGGVYVHVIGAESLLSGTPVYLGWVPLFLLSLAISAFTVIRQKSREQALLLGAAAIGITFGPVLS